MAAMTFTQAAHFIMPFGKYKGQSLDTIAESDAGLLWLDWLAGERNAVRNSAYSSRPAIDEALIAYLEDKTIAAAITALVRK